MAGAANRDNARIGKDGASGRREPMVSLTTAGGEEGNGDGTG